jgi:hypothetical protein
MNIDLETWLQTAILMTGVIGAVLNAKQIIYGFHFWIVCNLLVVNSSMMNDQYGMIFLYAFYVAVCMYGIYFKKIGSRSK